MKTDIFNPDNWTVYYINLECRKDKRVKVENVFKSKGICFNRFNAVKGEDFKDFPEIKSSILNNKLILDKVSYGTLGCLLSHYSIIKKHYELNTDKVLAIFEDDIEICQDFNERVNYLNNYFNDDWDMFYLGVFFDINIEDKYNNYIWRLKKNAFGTHAYLINPKSIKRILDMVIKKSEDVDAIDQIYSSLLSELKVYTFVPGMVCQTYDKSDIEGRVKDQLDINKRLFGKYIFSKNLKKFYPYQTNKFYIKIYRLLHFYDSLILGKIGPVLRFILPSVYETLKPYFPDKQ